MKRISIHALLSLMLLQSVTLMAQDGHWEVLKTTNETPARSECGLAVVNGKLYLIGGDGGGSRTVQSFDPQTLTWTKRTEAPIDMHHFQAVPYKNNIYVLDAFYSGGFPDQVPMSNVYKYNPEKNTWQKGGEIPAERRRAGAGAAEYDSKLYLVAGIQHGHSSGTTNMFDMYDPETEKWTSLPDAPHIRDHCSATVVKDKLYVVGGRNTSYHETNNFMAFFSHTVTDVDCYDFKTGKWSTIQARLPLGSGGGAVVNLKDVLYYMGGERATSTERNAPRKNTYYLDPSFQLHWPETDSMHDARNGMTAVVLNNKIYATGGSGSIEVFIPK
jgi:N-acetylneuraminic acid mutarotase